LLIFFSESSLDRKWKRISTKRPSRKNGPTPPKNAKNWRNINRDRKMAV
jgi:hypothetical protein